MKILFPTTRDLCYFSADFFAAQITKALERQGAEVVRLPLPETIVDGKPVTTDFSPLEKYEGQHFDAIIDINSKLPYLEAEPGVRYLDTFDAPFFNIILDHPLYHHPGLAFRLKRYCCIAIDRCHNAYIEKYYPWIMKTFCLPLAGTSAAEAADADRMGSDAKAVAPDSRERIPRLLFPGTFEPEPCLFEEAEKLPAWAGRIVKDLYGAWNPEEAPMEDAVEAYLRDLRPMQADEILGWFEMNERTAAAAARKENAGGNPLLSRELFPLVMNYLYPLDRLTRFEMRKRVITALADAGAALDIQGEGWETTGILDRPNVHAVTPMPIGPAIETMAEYRAVLDINPNFYAGLHDRVSTALINHCLTFSNMSEETAPETPLLRHYSSFDTDALCEAVLDTQNREFAVAESASGAAAFSDGGGNAADGAGAGGFPISWDEYAMRIYHIIESILV